MAMNSKNFSMDEIKHLADSPAGKELISLLNKADKSHLQTATQLAASGNMDAAKEALLPLLNSPQIQSLLKQLGGSGNG